MGSVEQFFPPQRRCYWWFLVLALLVAGCTAESPADLRPEAGAPQDTAAFAIGDLSGVFVDNGSYGADHREGYNGIAELYHQAQDSTLFVPAFAGFNLEHLFGGDSLAQLFEPREHPMELYRTDEAVLLYQPPTPRSNVESLIRFEPVGPHYIDVTYRCVVHESDFFNHGYAGVFWASYINAPADKRIYFRGTPEGEAAARWISAFSDEHGVASTHRAAGTDHEFYFAPNFNASLASHFSSYRFTEPYYYGRFHNMAFMYMFDTSKAVRFSQSPTGGGSANPAWDFQFLIPDVQYGKTYSFRARLVYKPFDGTQDLRDEYRNWKQSLED